MKQVLISVQVGAALLLVTSGIAIIMLWLICATLSMGNSALAPWTAAGVQRFGLLFILLAAIPGAPGLVWSARLSYRVNTLWGPIIKLVVRLGKFFFLVGAASAILIPIIAAFR